MANHIEDQGAKQLRAVTPSDTAELELGPCRALWVGVSGDVAVIAVGDTSAVTLVGVPAGVLPVMAKRVMATNTDATDIVALY